VKNAETGIIEWVLRLGIAGTFIGHGCLAINANPAWIPLITTVGFSANMAINLLPVIGILDIIIALLVLVKPYKPVLYWVVFWTFITALSRVFAGQGILEFIERFSNIACPLALLLYISYKEKKQDTDSVKRKLN